MKLFDCPVIGRRPISEFDYFGEVRRPPVQADGSVAPDVWSDFVFNRAGAPGVLREWWYHRPTGRWYVMERDTLKDEVLRFIDIQEVRYELPA
ncbi:sarcosine oxidase subunit delta [Nitrincola tapanii]|jgi:sarcosine oxidase, subunit delta|uniref:Sarcosine oxidase subunit delta n=1 Tax=Nitrincola tapanii TaxID=1708751 RepID=A0A5A9W0X8_9GAMM|nr:sarcosine oxidase subunit delta [Nitrincola tapanii]KAA0874430.1 sarcosine oxidase subunit delta [Nitrincola tapanii]